MLLLSGRDQPSSLGPVDIPPWKRQRRFPGTTLMIHGAPALVLAQHLGRNLRFKGSAVCDRPRSNSCRHQCRSRQAPSEHARPVLGQRTTVVIEQIPCLCADISVRNVRPHNARTRVLLRVFSSDRTDQRHCWFWTRRCKGAFASTRRAIARVITNSNGAARECFWNGSRNTCAHGTRTKDAPPSRI